MALPGGGGGKWSCAWLVPVLLALLTAGLLVTSVYAFRVRDPTPNADSDCPEGQQCPAAVTLKPLKQVSVRGSFVKPPQQPPDDDGDEEEVVSVKKERKSSVARPWSRLSKIEDDEDEAVSADEEDDEKVDSDDAIVQIEVEEDEEVTEEDEEEDEDEDEDEEEIENERKVEEERKRLAREKEEKRKEEEKRKKVKEEQERRKREEEERKRKEKELEEKKRREEEEKKKKEKELEEKKRKEEEERKRKEKEAAERRKKEETERRLREEAERRLKEEAERRLREDAERRKREEEERRLREEEERRKKEEEERRLKEEEERRRREEEEKRLKEEEERRLREEEEERQKKEEERRRKEEEERRKKQEEKRKKEEEERRLREERRKKEEEERHKREEEERRKREIEERRKREEEERRKREEEERRKRIEEERRKREEEERRKRVEEERRKRVEEERRKREEEERRKREEEERRKREEEEKRKKEEEERRKKEEERRKKEEEERRLEEEEEKRKKEEEERKKREKEAAERKKKEEEERKKKELEQKKEAERKKKEKEEEEKKRKQDEEDETERLRDQEEDRKRVERVKREAEEKRKRDEEERKKRFKPKKPKNDDDDEDEEDEEDEEEEDGEDEEDEDSSQQVKLEKVKTADKEKAKSIEALRPKAAVPKSKTNGESKKSAPTKKPAIDESAKKKRQKPRGPEASLSLAELNDMILSVPTFVPNFTAVEDPACQKHGKIFLRQLRGYKLWALQMLDSSAKVPAGLLRGNVNQLGDFDQCLGVQARVKIEQKTVRVQGKYCLASMDLYPSHPAAKLPVNLMQSRALIRGNMRDPGHFVPRFTTANWAICLPAACSAKDARKSIEDALENYNMTTGIRFVVNVNPDMCYVKQKAQSYSKETIGVLYFYAIFVCLAIVATLRDYFATLHEKGSYSERIIMAFSLKRTLKALFGNKETSPSDIGCIHGIRSLSTIALYAAHKLIPTSRIPYANRVSLTEVAGHPLSSILRASLVYTDSFLLLSGVLTAYNMAKELNKRGEIRWFCRLVGRFIRLTPPLLAVVFWYAFVMEHTGSGPQWNAAVKTNADICKENAWINLLYVQNFFPFEEMCATHTHQLALDVQLSLVAPALVFFLQIKPIIGIIIVFFLLQMSATLRYFATSNNNLSLVIFHGMSTKQLYKTANLTYALPHHRATPYLLGVTLGVLLYYTGKKVRIHKIINMICWVIALALGSWSLISPWHLARRDYVYDVEEATHYAVISPILSALALSWTIFACFTNNGGFVNRFLTSHWMVVFSRLSYAIYLSQFAVFFYNVGTTRYSSEFETFRFMDPYEALCVVSVSIVLTLLFDIPMQEVKNIIMEVSDSLPVESEKSTNEAPIESNNIKKITQKLTPDEEEEPAPGGWNWTRGTFIKSEPLEYEENGVEEYRSSRLKRQDIRRMSMIRSEAYDEWAAQTADSRRTSRSDDDGRTSRSDYRLSNAGMEDEDGYLPPRDRYYSSGYSRSPMRDLGRRSASRERLVPKEPEITRDYSKKPLITISKEEDYQRSPRSSMSRFADQQRSMSTESELDSYSRRSSLNRRSSAEPRISDEDDWEEDLRIRRSRFVQERLSSQERVPPPVTEEVVDEDWDAPKRRSSAEGKLALLKEPAKPGNMELWTVSKMQLGSSQEPDDEEYDEEMYLQQRREYRESGPPLREEFEGDDKESQRKSFTSESLPTSFEEEDDANSVEFSLNKDKKMVTVQDLSKIASEDEPLTETSRNTLDVTSGGLFKRESIVKSQASEEDPEYLLPERPKLVEQEQEHPFKKAWQLQKSRSEEESSATFVVKESKPASVLEQQKEEPEETKPEEEEPSNHDTSGAQSDFDFNPADVSCDVTLVWQPRSAEAEDTKSTSKSESSSTSSLSRHRWLDDDYMENLRNRRKSEEDNWTWTERDT